MVGIGLGGDALKVAAAVKDLGEAVLGDLVEGEGPAAQEEVGVLRHGGQAVQLGLVQHFHLHVGGLAVVLHGAGDHGGDVGVLLPLRGVPLVGGEEVGLAVYLIQGDAVGHVHPQEVLGLEVGLLVLLVGVQLVAGLAVVLEAQGVDAGELAAGQVQHGDAVGLLQGHIGGGAGGVHRDVLGLKVGGGVQAALQQDVVGHQGLPLAVPGLEGDGVGGGGLRLQVHDGHGALGIGAVFIALAGFPLVGGEDIPAVGGEDHVVRLHPGGVMGQVFPGIVEEQDGAVGGIVLGLHGHSDAVVGGVHGHAGQVPEGEAGDHPAHVHPGFQGEGLRLLPGGEAGQGDDVQLLLPAVDQVELLVILVVGYDLGHAPLLVGVAGGIAGDLLQGGGGLPVLGGEGAGHQPHGQDAGHEQGSAPFHPLVHGCDSPYDMDGIKYGSPLPYGI